MTDRVLTSIERLSIMDKIKIIVTVYQGCYKSGISQVKSKSGSSQVKVRFESGKFQVQVKSKSRRVCCLSSLSPSPEQAYSNPLPLAVFVTCLIKSIRLLYFVEYIEHIHHIDFSWIKIVEHHYKAMGITASGANYGN
jgi:hypothetical protein